MLEPSLDRFIVPLGGIRLWNLGTPVQFVQQAVEVIGMVCYTKLAFDQPPDAPQAPTFGTKASGARTAFQLAQQPALLQSREFGRTAGSLARAQMTQTTRTKTVRPLIDRGATYSESARNPGLSQAMFSEQAPTG